MRIKQHCQKGSLPLKPEILLVFRDLDLFEPHLCLPPTIYPEILFVHLELRARAACVCVCEEDLLCLFNVYVAAKTSQDWN